MFAVPMFAKDYQDPVLNKGGGTVDPVPPLGLDKSVLEGRGSPPGVTADGLASNVVSSPHLKILSYFLI